MPERERQESNDDTEEADGDVEMEKDEIDRLVRETKRMAEERTDDDVDMSASKSSQPSSRVGSRRTRTTPDPQAVFGGKTKEQEEEEEDERNAQEQEQDEEQRGSQNKLPLDSENSSRINHPLHRHRSERRCDRQHRKGDRYHDPQLPERQVQTVSRMDLYGISTGVLYARQERQVTS